MTTRVLVPIESLENESISSGLIDLLATVDVVVLGDHVLPEQTLPDQARAQYEQRALSALEDIAEEFRAADGGFEARSTETSPDVPTEPDTARKVAIRLAFTHDRRKSIDRVAEETNPVAFTITGTTGAIDRLLVP